MLGPQKGAHELHNDHGIVSDRNEETVSGIKEQGAILGVKVDRKLHRH